MCSSCNAPVGLLERLIGFDQSPPRTRQRRSNRRDRQLERAGNFRVIQSFFPAVPASLLQAAIARYLELGIWGSNPILPRVGYERLKAGLVSGGFAKGTPFETAVDNSLAEQVVAEDPPALN